METSKKAKDEMTETMEFDRDELAQMTVEAVLARVPPMDHRTNLIEYYNNCSICGSLLDFTHVTHFVSGQVKEEGSCSCCQVVLKNEVHQLQ